MAEEIRISGQMNTVVRPDEAGIPTDVEVPASKSVVSVGGQIVSATLRRALSAEDVPEKPAPKGRGVSSSRQRSRWDSAHVRPTGGPRLLG